jgi:hypothetical protein
MLLVAVSVVAVAGFCVSRLHGIFGSNHNTATPSGFANEIRKVGQCICGTAGRALGVPQIIGQGHQSA